MKQSTTSTESSARGRFITMEGPEGSGKTTHLRHLAEMLRSIGIPVLCTREPGGTRIGEAIRDILQHDRAGEPPCPEAETLLFSASRAQLVRSVIQPALADGTWVLCDRFADSTTVYQGYGRGFDPETLLELHRFALGNTWPDLTLLLDVDVDIGFQRLAQRTAGGGLGPDRMERETRDFHRRVRAGYLELADRWPDRFRTVDASVTPEAVADAVWKEVRDAFSLRL